MFEKKQNLMLTAFLIVTFFSIGTCKIVRVVDGVDKVLLPPTTTNILRFSPNISSVAQPLLYSSGQSVVRQSANGQYLIPGEDGCVFYPEIVMVQDISSSYEDDMVNLQHLMPELFQFFQDEFQGHAKFGIVSFVDKSVEPWGYTNDFCAAVNLPLIAVTDADSVAKAQEVFGGLSVGGGKDYFDGANEAMFRAAASNSVGWSDQTHDPATGRPILRLLVTATDAAVHDSWYNMNEQSPPLPSHDFARNSTNRAELDMDINSRCSATDYPTGEDIKFVLQERGIVPVVLSGVNYYESSGKKRQWKQYTDMLKRTNQSNGPWADLETGLASYFESFMKDTVRVNSVVEMIDSSSSDFIEVFRKAMSQVTEMTCLVPTTTTTTTTTTTQETKTLPSTTATVQATVSTTAQTTLAEVFPTAPNAASPTTIGTQETRPAVDIPATQGASTAGVVIPSDTTTKASTSETVTTTVSITGQVTTSSSEETTTAATTTLSEATTVPAAANATSVSETENPSSNTTTTTTTTVESGGELAESPSSSTTTTTTTTVGSDGNAAENSSSSTTTTTTTTTTVESGEDAAGNPSGSTITTTTTTTTVESGEDAAENPSGSTTTTTTTTVESDGNAAENPSSSTTTTTTTTTTIESGGNAAVIIGAAAGGGAAAVAGVAALLVKKFGIAGFGSSTPDISAVQEVENVEVTQDREQFEQVTADFFN